MPIATSDSEQTKAELAKGQPPKVEVHRAWSIRTAEYCVQGNKVP